MAWHIITQIGPPDRFTPALQADEPRLVVGIDQPAAPSNVTHQILSRVFNAGFAPQPIAADLLNVAVSVFTADLRAWRGYEADRWTRSFTLYVPVSDPDIWNRSKDTLSEIASFLTGDRWHFEFRPRVWFETAHPATRRDGLPKTVCLFSGGLDSFVGGIDLLAPGEKIILVGHYGTKRDQDDVFKALLPQYADLVTPFWFHLLPPLLDAEHRGEPTMRSRSLLFFALGTAVASALGDHRRLLIPENGLISLNVPLTPARLGSHSTRTTHPYTMALYRRLLASLGIQLSIELPYRFKTKGEMLVEAGDEDTLRKGVHKTMSCAHPAYARYQNLPSGQHCGYCVPCIIRRAALHRANLDTEPRHVDVLNPELPARAPAGADKRAFQIALQRLQSMKPFEIAAEVLNSGPIEPLDLSASVEVYVRGMEEVRCFLERC